MYQQAKLVDDLETLPLFSGTPMREPEQKAAVQAKPRQPGSFLVEFAGTQGWSRSTARSSGVGVKGKR